MEYKNYIIELNADNIYNYKPATYCFYNKNETDGHVSWGKTIKDCKIQINDIIKNK
jgi:hypothetical protein